MNKREHAVLSLFYDEGHQEVTASFLAYRMRMRSADATALLDSMVREGILDLHIGDEGHLSYRLPPGAAIHLASRRPPRHTSEPAYSPAPSTNSSGESTHHRSGYLPPQPPAPEGTDALPGYSRQAHSASFQGGRSVHDGTDGSVHSFSPSSHHSPVHPGVFVQPDASPLAAPTATADAPGTSPSPWHHDRSPQGRHQALVRPHSPSALLPAQSPGHYPDRIPILAGALSLLFPGMGQFYNGEFGKGFLLLFSTAFLYIFFLFWIVWLWSVIDAYMVAETRNQLAMQAEEPPPAQPGGYLPGPRTPNSNSNAL